jgi:prepilin-type N-terminal cleavage/methylation domain-containing protein
MKLHPGTRSGFTLLEILIVVAIIGLILAIAVPNFLKYRQHAQTQLCIENLGQIESAKQQWGLENKMSNGDEPEVNELIGPDRWLKRNPECPSGGTYQLNPIGEPATCTFEGHNL